MKRDWDLIRKILVTLEEKPDRQPLPAEAVDGTRAQDVAYNMGLLLERHLIEGYKIETIGMGYGAAPVMATTLTWGGHELLDSIRQDSTWGHIKESALSKGLDLTFDVVVSLAKAYIGAKIGTPL